jgi:hypothetical protein
VLARREPNRACVSAFLEREVKSWGEIEVAHFLSQILHLADPLG